MHCCCSCRAAVGRRFAPCIVRRHQPTNLATTRYLPIYRILQFSITDLFIFFLYHYYLLFFAIRAIARAHAQTHTYTRTYLLHARTQTCPPADSLIRPKFNLFVSISIPSIRPRYNTSNLSESIALYTCVPYTSAAHSSASASGIYLKPTTGHSQVIRTYVILCVYNKTHIYLRDLPYGRVVSAAADRTWQ